MTDPIPGSIAEQQKKKRAAGTRSYAPNEPAPDDQRPLPSAVDSERCVLSCVMQAPDFAGVKVMRMLKCEDFSIEAHSLMFELLINQINLGRLVDPITVTQLMADKGFLEKVGGPSFVSEIYTASPNPGHAEHYAREVRDKAKCRRSVQACWDTADAIMAEPTEKVLLEAAGSLVDSILLNTQNEERRGPQHIKEALAEGIEELEENIRNRGHVTGEMATGFTDLDRMFITGLRRTEYVTIAGDTSMGKTSLAVQILENIATGTGHYREFYEFDHAHVDDWQAEVAAGRASSRYGKKMVLLVCLESSQIEMALKMLMGRAEVNVQEIQRGMISREAQHTIHKAAGELCQAPFWIWDAAGVTVEELGAELKSFKLQHPDLAVVCIDHCGLLDARGVREKGNEMAMCGYISNYLRNLWKKLNVVGMPLWQLSRKVAERSNKRPNVADIRSSGRIEQDSSKVIMPYRPGHYDENSDDSEAFLVIAKNRGGPKSIEGIQMRWDGAYTRFYSEQKDEQDVWRPRLRLFSLKESERQIK